jgi:hypothetical protein
MQVEILIPLAFFALVFGSWYIFITSRNKERLALIEKGADPQLFKSKAKENSNHTIFKLGLFLVGIALGILAGNALEAGGMNEVTAYFSMIFLFGGIALVASFFLQRVLKDKESNF